MDPLFAERDGVRVLSVGARHVKPCSDDLVMSVQRLGGTSSSVVLDRDQAERLHAALGMWLAEGWPGVAHKPGGDARRAEDYARRVVEYTPVRAAEEAALAAPCEPSGSLSQLPHDNAACSCGVPYECGVEIPGGHIMAMIADPRPETFALAERASRGACGVPLRHVPNGRGSDWQYVGPDGAIGADHTPEQCSTAAGIKALPFEAYTLLNTYSDYGLRNPFWHNHRPAPCGGVHPSIEGLPECHGAPMWAAPGGWVCRKRFARFPYPDH